MHVQEVSAGVLEELFVPDVFGEHVASFVYGRYGEVLELRKKG